ncbi:MAG: DUF2382 domain-containing protein [Acidobacteriaceae bacterium]|nr:DUF2382 domain-containing protein [Acidobacteriaceae bacterium]
MADEHQEVVIPVIGEELSADAVPVATGGIRVTKRVHSHEEVIEQELQKSHVEVKRVKTERVVDGPQPVRRVGNTLIVPVVSEVLRIEKQWVMTEEIHLTEVKESETVQNKISLNRETAQIERIDAAGQVVAPLEQERQASDQPAPPASMLQSTAAQPRSKEKVLGRPRSVLKRRLEEK